MRLAIVIPTYNEAENIRAILARIYLRHPEAFTIIVDDNSPDRTAEIATRWLTKGKRHFEVIQRAGKLGLGTAYVRGFEFALERECDAIVQMDADLSHDPAEIKPMLEKLKTADVVVGSRYITGGKTSGWPVHRLLLSDLGNRFLRWAGRLHVRDASAGFKAWQPTALASLDFASFECKGFGFQVEAARACERLGLRVVEHPITFTDRKRGVSKMSLGILAETGLKLLRR